MVMNFHVETRNARRAEDPRLAIIPDWTPGTVYFLRAAGDGLVKIGFTTRPVPHRVREIQKSCPVPLEVVATIPDADLGLERSLHKNFYGERAWGEWYQPCELLEGVIAHYGATS